MTIVPRHHPAGRAGASRVALERAEVVFLVTLGSVAILCGVYALTRGAWEGLGGVIFAVGCFVRARLQWGDATLARRTVR